MDHLIEDRTADPTFDLLVSQRPSPQLVADDLLIAKHLRLGQRAAMIAALLFPSFTALFPNRSNRLIPRQRRGFTVAMLLDLGVFARRNDRLNGAPFSRIGQRLEDLALIIGPIAAQSVYRVVDLLQQRLDLGGVIYIICLLYTSDAADE